MAIRLLNLYLGWIDGDYWGFDILAVDLGRGGRSILGIVLDGGIVSRVHLLRLSFLFIEFNYRPSEGWRFE